MDLQRQIRDFLDCFSGKPVDDRPLRLIADLVLNAPHDLFESWVIRLLNEGLVLPEATGGLVVARFPSSIGVNPAVVLQVAQFFSCCDVSMADLMHLEHPQMCCQCMCSKGVGQITPEN